MGTGVPASFCVYFSQKQEKTLTSVCVGLSVLTRFKVNIFPREQAPGQNIHLSSSSLARHHILREQKHRLLSQSKKQFIYGFSARRAMFLPP